MNEQYPYGNRLSEDSSFQESDEIQQDDSYVREWESDDHAFDPCETKIIARLPDLGSYKTVPESVEPPSGRILVSIKKHVEVLRDRLSPMTKSVKTAYHKFHGKRLARAALILALVLAVAGGVSVHRKNRKKQKQAAKAAIAAQKEAEKSKAGKDAKVEPAEKKTDKKSIKPIEKSPELPRVAPVKKPTEAPLPKVAEKAAATPAKTDVKTAAKPAKVAEKSAAPAKTPKAETPEKMAAVPVKPVEKAVETESVTKSSISTVIASRNVTETKGTGSDSPWERTATDGYTPWTMNSADRLVAAESASASPTTNTAVPTTGEVPGFSRTTATTAAQKPAPSRSPMPQGTVPQHYVPTYARTPVPSPAPQGTVPPTQPQQGAYVSQQYGAPYGTAIPQAALPTGQYGNQYVQTPSGGYVPPQNYPSAAPQGQPTVAMTTMPGTASHYPVPQNQAPQYQTPQYQAPQYQTPQYQAPQYQAPQYQAPQTPQPQANPGQGTVPYQPQYQPQYPAGNPMPAQGGYYPAPAQQAPPQTAAPVRNPAIPTEAGTIYSHGNAYQQPQGTVYSQGGAYQQGTAPAGTQRLY